MLRTPKRFAWAWALRGLPDNLRGRILLHLVPLSVGLRGLEPRTSTLSVARSNNLSYKPDSAKAPSGQGPSPAQ